MSQIKINNIADLVSEVASQRKARGIRPEGNPSLFKGMHKRYSGVNLDSYGAKTKIIFDLIKSSDKPMPVSEVYRELSIVKIGSNTVFSMVRTLYLARKIERKQVNNVGRNGRVWGYYVE